MVKSDRPFLLCLPLPYGEEEGQMTQISSISSIYYFTNNCSWRLWWYSSFLVWCLIPVETSAHITASYSVVPLLVAAQEIHFNTYIINHIVGHDDHTE